MGPVAYQGMLILLLVLLWSRWTEDHGDQAWHRGKGAFLVLPSVRANEKPDQVQSIPMNRIIIPRSASKVPDQVAPGV